MAGVAWVLTTGAAVAVCAQVAAPVTNVERLRIVLVPLDDRPVCVQYPRMLAPIAHADVIAPPEAMLGRFTTPGDTSAIATWLRAQDWRSVDGLIVSTDMLAYGGLVASRANAVDADNAMRRLDVLDEIRRANPSLRVYGFSVLMRLAPTATLSNATFRESLARYAELAADPANDDERRELTSLETSIPRAALDDYKTARERNRRVNLAAVDLVRRGVFDFLVVSQDDAKPRGLHLADRAAVTKAVADARLQDRVGIQPGADEVAMLLLARAVMHARGLAPTMSAAYSSERARTMVAPFEDRQLHETVDFQIAAAGASVVARGRAGDLTLYVFADRHDTGAPAAFASTVARDVKAGGRAIVADVDPRGDVQGASPAFTDALLAAGVVPSLYGYASWNTAGNTIGTAIPHGLLAWAGARLAMTCTSPAFAAMADAQATFMVHRLANDLAYQGVLRPRLNARLRGEGLDTLHLGGKADDVAAEIRRELAPSLSTYVRSFGTEFVPPSPEPADVAVGIGDPRDFDVTLPWGRTFEAAIAFDIPTRGLTWPARHRPLCVDAK